MSNDHFSLKQKEILDVNVYWTDSTPIEEETEVLRLLVSHKAPKKLKVNAGRESIRLMFWRVFESCIESKTHFKSFVVHIQTLSSHEIRPLVITIQQEKEHSVVEELATMSTVVLSASNEEEVGVLSKVSLGHDGTVLINDDVLFVFKVSPSDGFYVMIVGIANHVKDKETKMKSIIDKSCDALKEHFRNEISLVDAISEIPHIEYSQQETDPTSTAAVFGEIIDCNN